MGFTMSIFRETIDVNLANVRSSQQLFDLVGASFNFGGPDDNAPVTTPTAGKGWGKNWDALADSFSYLPEGGIWGTSHIFHFPLLANFKCSSAFRAENPEGFNRLSEILENTSARDGANSADS